MVDAALRPTPVSAWTTPERQVSTRGREALVASLIALVAFATYWASPVRLQTDSYWTAYSAQSLIEQGNLDLREYRPRTDQVNPFQIEHDGASRRYRAPLVSTLTYVPFIGIASAVGGSDLDQSLRDGHTQPWDGIAAAAIAALTVALVYLVMRRVTRRWWVALATTAVFAFGTQVWSTASRTTWMHGPSMLFLTAALYCAVRARSAGASSPWFAGLGASLALAYFARPTNAVAALAFALWALSNGWPALRRCAAGAVSVGACVVALNVHFYGSLFQPYFSANRLALTGVTLEAMLGNLVSPSRGLFVFVPAAVLSIGGFLLRRRSGTLDRLDITIGATIVVYWVAVSMFPHWYAGYAYGPRFLADVAPLVVWFLPPIFVWMVDPTSPRRAARIALVALVLAASVAVQARGALVQDTAAWNWTPHDIDLDPARVWDWSDPQFLR